MKKQPTGYITVDHRGSPGLDETAARALGYAPEQVAEGRFFEADTLRCAHCGTHSIKNPMRTRPRGHCAKCNQYLCDNCVAAAHSPDYIHIPFEQQIDRILHG